MITRRVMVAGLAVTAIATIRTLPYSAMDEAMKRYRAVIYITNAVEDTLQHRSTIGWFGEQVAKWRSGPSLLQKVDDEIRAFYASPIVLEKKKRYGGLVDLNGEVKLTLVWEIINRFPIDGMHRLDPALYRAFATLLPAHLR